ncbi:MAG: DUF2628 domain-containing protein [Pseudolabrys sp.]
MPTYTVHEPPLPTGPRKTRPNDRLHGEAVPDPERFVFVRDGFNFWAFVFGPLWMLMHGLWLVLIGYVALSAVLIVGLRVLQAPSSARMAVMCLLALLVGFEAATLRRFSLRKWKTAGIVVGEDEEEAERRFFAVWLERAAAPASSTLPMVRPISPSSPPIIGLFPDAGDSR